MHFHESHKEVLGAFNAQLALNVSRPLCMWCVQNCGVVYAGVAQERKSGQ